MTAISSEHYERQKVREEGWKRRTAKNLRRMKLIKLREENGVKELDNKNLFFASVAFIPILLKYAKKPTSF
jgi:hypothetical protein